MPQSLTWGSAGICWGLDEGGAALGGHGQGHLLLLVLGQRRLHRFRVDVCEREVLSTSTAPRGCLSIAVFPVFKACAGSVHSSELHVQRS